MKKKERIDTRIDHIPLTSSPFAGLKDTQRLEDPPTVSDVESGPEAQEESGQTAPNFSVARTRKGGWPVRVEKRMGNRVVTIIEQIDGDTRALLKQLKEKCGAGGAARHDSVEIQGDHRQAVEAWLTQTLHR